MAEGGDDTHRCTICLEDFTKPKILPCFHTFCEHCLESHIASQIYDLNRFRCPNCRTEIRVPFGGASKFSTNFYIQPNDKTQKYFCPRHKTKEIEFYCLDCHVTMCCSCLLLEHTTHSKTDLTEIDQDVREQLNISKKKIEAKIHELDQHCESLTSQIFDIKNQAKTACANVDKQVKRVCEEVKKHGGDIKFEINKIREEETNKFQTLHDDVIRIRSSLQKSLNYMTEVLSRKSTFPVVDALTNAQTLTENSRPTNLDLPTAIYVHYPMVEIDVETLKQVLGDELKTIKSRTWTSTFGLDQIVTTDVNYDSDDVIIHGMPWSICVKRHTANSTLGIYMHLNGVDGNKTVSASFILKLLNINDVRKSLVRQYSSVFTSGGEGYGEDFISWEKLRNRKNGFIDKKNRFTIHATVKIML
ncbi:tripartite motif-containing protein 2-like [Patella vulgata]|uniref:tripartite motif-containing protein 2-like n=1 Tax=Patella vulgata TaxID=6465 RepID=UPI00217F6A6E|nr:tripartite motif-containing protein 2-like [Patella vulgata]